MKLTKQKNKEMKATCFVVIFSVLMATAISKPLWAMLPFLKMAQTSIPLAGSHVGCGPDSYGGEYSVLD